MRHTGPLPPYQRAQPFHGFPDYHITAAMLAVADRNMIVRLWRYIAYRSALAMLAHSTYDLAPLGTMIASRHLSRQILSVKTGQLITLPETWRQRFRPSRYFRSRLKGTNEPPGDIYFADIDACAVAASMTPDQARAVWPLMAARIIYSIAINQSIEFEGFGLLHAITRPARMYRDWRTGQIKRAPATALPALRPSRKLAKWLAAGVIPAPV